MSDTHPIVWSRPGCQACRLTKRAFEKLGLVPVEKQLDEEAASRFREQGHLSLPVVEWRGEVWAGFRPDRITVA